MLKFLSSIKIKHSQEENIVYKLFVGFLTYAVIYYFFLKPLTIGQSFKYNLFVEWIPFIIGIVIITLLRLNFLKRLHKGFKSIIERVFTYILLIIMASMISYSSFGITAEAIFLIVGYNVAKNSNQTVMTLPIEKVIFTKGKGIGRGPKIYFYFNDNYENFRIGNELFKQLKDIDPKKIHLEIKCKKGLFGVYYVDSWSAKY